MSDVVSCILQKGNKILLLQRSQKVGTYKGMWGGITGFVDEDETPLQTAYKEIFEETGIKDNQIKLKLVLKPISFTDIYRGKQYDWVVHPFVFELLVSQNIRCDWEHEQYRWVDPLELDKFNTVPRFKEIIRMVFCGK